ncbi:MAG: Fic family protein [Thermonemataceae bacterium]|nr:Fic family protein [Thermonemataceae bacterium]
MALINKFVYTIQYFAVSVEKAINFRLDFLYLHPFADGNGRTAQIRPDYNTKLNCFL